MTFVGKSNQVSIREDDGLSRMVCMRCIGTLEFVSDFHNKCHQTQQQLLLNKEHSRKVAKGEIKTDLEMDKENAFPRSNIETNETLNDISIRPKRGGSRIGIKLECNKKIIYKNGDFEDDVIPRLDHDGNSKGNAATVYPESLNSSGIEPILAKSEGRIIWKGKTSLQRRDRLASEMREANGKEDDQMQVPTSHFKIRKSGRKGSKNNGGSLAANEKLRNNEKKNYNFFNFGKIALVANNAGEVGMTENLQTSCVSLRKNKHQEVPALTDTVKIEMLHSENVIEKINTLPRIPNDIVISARDGPSRIISSGSTAKSPRPGDEAEETQNRDGDAIVAQKAKNTTKIVFMENQRTETKMLPKASVVRKSVIESVKNGETFGVDTESGLGNTNENRTDAKLNLLNDEMVSQRRNTNFVDMPEKWRQTSPLKASLRTLQNKLNENEELSVRNFRGRRTNFKGQYGKLSELITSEQKEIIESLYTVNMGVVNDEEVYKNIKILDKIKIKCGICGQTYSRMDKCQVHVWSHLGMKPYCCKSCEFVTLTVSNIRCHIRKRHLKIKPFQCNLCEKTYGTAVLLEEHMNSHTGAKPYKCKLCDYATSNRQVLSYHRTTHKPMKDISCEVCDKKFFSNCRMRAHMIMHNKDKSLMCKFCSTYLCNAAALEKHYQKIHSRDYICSTCGVRTRSKKALTNHENVHSEAKYRCPVCSNAYKSKHMLKEHLLKHQGIRKYKCELCQKSFAQQSHIAAHMSVHMGKRYPCPACNKLFNRRDNMRIHTRRCKIFKSDPDVEKLWASQLSTQFAGRDDQQNTVPETPVVSDARRNSTEILKTDTEILETDLALLTVNLSTDKTDYSILRSPSTNVTTEDPRDYVHDQHSVLRIGEVDIFPLSKTNTVTTRGESSTVITESVLGPEHF